MKTVFNPRHTTRRMPPSLIAEELDRRPLDEQRAFYKGLVAPSVRLPLGWNLIETGLQSPATDGHYVEQGYRTLVSAKDAGQLRQQDEYKVRLALAYRHAFFERIDGKAPEDALFDHTYRKVGRVLGHVAKLNLHPSQEKGQLSELISLEGLLRMRRYFPYVTSLREEASRDRRRNHDHYILGHYDGYLKVGFNVKSDIAPQASSPAVPLRMGRIIEAAIAADQEQAAYLDRFPTDEMYRLESYRWIASLFLKDQGSERLTSSERAVLDSLGNTLSDHAGSYIEPIPYTQVPDFYDRPGNM
jgi:hypothetical protein